MLAQGLVINRARVPADRLYDSHDGRCHQEYAHNGLILLQGAAKLWCKNKKIGSLFKRRRGMQEREKLKVDSRHMAHPF